MTTTESELEEVFKKLNDTFETEITAQEFAIDEAETKKEGK